MRTLEHPALDSVLSAAATLLGMEIVFLARIHDDVLTMQKVQARNNWLGLQPGLSSDLAAALCKQLLEGAPPSTSDAMHDPRYGAAAAPLGIRSYVGTFVRDGAGAVVGTLCGIDRGAVEVDTGTLAVLEQLAGVVSAHLGPELPDGVVIRSLPTGGWAVGEQPAEDLTSAMVLADLVAGDASPPGRPPKPDVPLDEAAQLRVAVSQLEHALTARVVVEQAIGVLTERRHASPRQAFERLRKVARSRGRRVHDLSRDIVLSATDPAVPLPPELARASSPS